MSAGIMSPKACIDCGGDAIMHRVTYVTIAIDTAIYSIFPPSNKGSFITNLGTKFDSYLGPPFLSLFVALGLAKKQENPDDKTLLLACCLWEEARARGINMWEWRLFGLARNIFVATYPNGKRITFEGIPVTPLEHERVWWMDDKARLKREFSKRELPVAAGSSARTEKEALAIYRSLSAPVILKPHSGSGSRHTILHITHESELVRAFAVAKQVSPQVVIEEELKGPVYRATVVDGTFVAALRRDPPSVVGDGVHTIDELVEEENKKPARSGPYFSNIRLYESRSNDVMNSAAAKELAWQGYAPSDVPPLGTRVHFHQKVNWSLGGTTADVTGKVHPDNIELFERAARELRAPVAGIDFIIADISKSWKEQDRCGILECNSMPFFDNHHLPFEGEPHNVAAKIWDMVTP